MAFVIELGAGHPADGNDGRDLGGQRAAFLDCLCVAQATVLAPEQILRGDRSLLDPLLWA